MYIQVKIQLDERGERGHVYLLIYEGRLRREELVV